MIFATVIFVFVTLWWLRSSNFGPFSIYNFYLASMFLLFLIPSYIDYAVNGYNSIQKVDMYFGAFIIFTHFFYESGRESKSFSTQEMVFIKTSNFYILLFFWSILFLIKLGLGVGFQPLVMLDRMLNPRNYTYIKEATGVINYIVGSVSIVLMYAAFNLRGGVNKALAPAIVFVLVVIPGSKATLLIFFLYYAVIKTRNRRVTIKSFFKKIKFILGGGIVLAVALVGAFSMYVQNNSGPVLDDMISYQEEYSFTKEIINDGDYNPKNTILGITDTLIALIPRQIYSGKPYVGFYNRFWRDRYDSARTARYHSSQFGILAEAYTFLGPLGVLVYAIITGLFLRLAEHIYKRSASHFDQFLYVFFCTYTYFYLRNGFLFFVPYMIAIQILIAFVCFRFLGERKTLFRLSGSRALDQL